MLRLRGGVDSEYMDLLVIVIHGGQMVHLPLRHVSSNATVCNSKQIIQESLGIFTDEMSLYDNNRRKVLQDSMSLSYYNIRKGGIINLVVRAMGGHTDLCENPDWKDNPRDSFGSGTQQVKFMKEFCVITSI